MRERLLTEVSGGTGPSRHLGWLRPAAVAASVLLAAGGIATIRAISGPQTPVPGGITGSTGAPGGVGSTGGVAGTDCGVFDLRQGERLPESAVRCLVEAAAAGEPARLRQTRPSVEGDPIVTVYTVDDRGLVQLVIDSRADSNGSGEIRRQDCARLRQVDGKLVVDGCTESR
ncbi:hypothetical protein D3H59_24730 [Micromonospora endophytica]|nr:hypothetical protein D3H59_24730 [Micromonospora endophytica]